MTLCTSCKAKIPTLATRTKRVNEWLSSLPAYHSNISDAFTLIEQGLIANGFLDLMQSPNEAGTPTSLHADVGEGKWIHITWHRMDSGRYEVVSYLN